MQLHQLKNKLQVEASQQWIKNDYWGTIAWATGVGKSRAALMAIQQLEMHRTGSNGLWLCPTEEMRDVDWPVEFENWGFTPNAKMICYASLGKENLSKYTYILYDEGHRITKANLEKLHEWKRQDPRRAALSLTATIPKMKREEEADRVGLYNELFPAIHRISTDEAVDMKLIRDFEISQLLFDLDKVNRTIEVSIRVKGQLTSFFTTEEAHYAVLNKKVQKAMYGKNQNFKFMAISARMQFLYNLPSKVRLAKDCLGSITIANPGRRIVVFSESIGQSEAICGEFVYHSGVDDTYLQMFQKREINIIGACRSLNEGKNLTEPDDGLMEQINSQERNFVQRTGRIIRLGENEERNNRKAQIVLLTARKTADEKWADSAMEDMDTTRIKKYNITKITPP